MFRTLVMCCVALFAVSPAKADLWGCEVLLCMANPQGPTAASACVPPITRLWHHLGRGRSWPNCDEAGKQIDTQVTRRTAGQGWCPAHLTFPDPEVSHHTLCRASASIDVVVQDRLVSRVWIGITDTTTGDLISWVEGSPR